MKNKLSFYKYFFVLISLVLIQNLYAQKFISLQGKIRDAKTGKALSYVNISLKNSTIGTVSNEEGYYSFHIPNKNRKDTLWVSSIGYNSYVKPIIQIKDNKLNIKLTPKIYSLSEMLAKPQNALEIVKKAIAKIPENYPAKAINMDGFYREMTFENDTCVEMAEAACEFYYCPYEKFSISTAMDSFFVRKNQMFGNYSEMAVSLYNKNFPNPDDILHIKEARSSKLHHKYRFKVLADDGPLGLLGIDVKNWLGVNYPSFVRKNKFTVQNIVKYGQTTSYAISIMPKSRNLRKIWEAKIYVDTYNHAIIKLETLWKKNKIKTNRYWNAALYKNKKDKCKDTCRLNYRKTTIEYKQIGKKWYVNYVKIKTDFDYIFSDTYIFKNEHPQINYKLNSELLINKISTNNVYKLSEEKAFKNKLLNLVYDYDLDYNKMFWENYNLIKKTKLQDSIIKQLEKQETLQEQFESRLLINDSLKAPVAMKIPQINPVTKCKDDYYWMQDIKNKAVLKYIEAENEYTENYTIPLKKLKRELFFELTHRNNLKIKHTDTIIKNNDYAYYYKKQASSEHYNLCRTDISNNKEELVLNIENKIKEEPNIIIFGISVSPDNKFLAYEELISGTYDSHAIIQNIENKQIIDTFHHAGKIMWKSNSSGFYYLEYSNVNRFNKIFYHELNSPNKQDKLVYEETNPQRDLYISIQDNNNYLLLESTNDLKYNELYLIKLNSSKTNIKKIEEYEEGLFHFVQIKNDTIYDLLTKDNGSTALYKSSIDKYEQNKQKSVIESKEGSFLSAYIVLKDYIVLIEEINMQKIFKIIDKQGNLIKNIDFKEEDSYSIGFSDKIYAKINSFTYSYSSLATPAKMFSYNIEKDKTTLKTEQKVKGYKRKNYVVKLLWASSKDGTKIPISLVYNKTKSKRNGRSALLLTAYGSYGSSAMEPKFSRDNLPLLDRGIIYAIAHVRGGNELGEDWHTQAIQLKKKNSFEDYIACAEYLIEKKYTSKGKIVAQGGSAGGLTIAAAVNQKTELFNTAILTVPFVDVLGSLMDSTSKFNSLEKVELGNPINKKVFEYIKSYSPYENIIAQNYPNMLYSIGLNDTRVEYWQSLKSVAKLRALKTDNNKLYLKTKLYSGHAGLSGIGGYYSELAFIYAFIFNNLGIGY